MMSPFGYIFPPQRPLANRPKVPSAGPLAGAAIPGISAAATPRYNGGGYGYGNDMMPNPTTPQVPVPTAAAQTPYEQWRQSWLKNNNSQTANGMPTINSRGPTGYLSSGFGQPSLAPPSNWTPPAGAMPVDPRFAGIPRDLAAKGYRRQTGPDGKVYWVPPGVQLGATPPGNVLY